MDSEKEEQTIIENIEDHLLVISKVIIYYSKLIFYRTDMVCILSKK